jgi:hypothetical protein
MKLQRAKGFEPSTPHWHFKVRSKHAVAYMGCAADLNAYANGDNAQYGA